MKFTCMLGVLKRASPHMELTNGRKARHGRKELDSIVMPLDGGGCQLCDAHYKRLRPYSEFFSRSEVGSVDGAVIKRILSFAREDR